MGQQVGQPNRCWHSRAGATWKKRDSPHRASMPHPATMVVGMKVRMTISVPLRPSSRACSYGMPSAMRPQTHFCAGLKESFHCFVVDSSTHLACPKADTRSATTHQKHLWQAMPELLLPVARAMVTLSTTKPNNSTFSVSVKLGWNHPSFLTDVLCAMTPAGSGLHRRALLVWEVLPTAGPPYLPFSLYDRQW